MSCILDQDMANENGSLGVFDGDDYKTLIEMEEFKSQVNRNKSNIP